MKKMLLATAGPAYYRMCSTDVYCSKQTSSSTKGNHHPSFLRFWNWAEENCRCSQNLWRRAENVVKTEMTNIRKWIARFYYFRHLYSAGSACVLLTIIAWNLPIDMKSLYLHCSLIYWVPSSCFCIVISLSPEVK